MTTLRPGLHVVRRDDHHLQIGVDPPWRLVVADEPAVQRLLGDLVAGRPAHPTSAEAHRALAALARADMLTDAAETQRVGATRGAVAVHGSGPAGEIRRVLRCADCAVRSDQATVTVLASDGQPDRDQVDALVRNAEPHLLVSAGPGGYTLGPFVAPGLTACLRCVDAHLGERDPRRAVVVQQLSGRGCGPQDPALEALVAAWAARDLVAYLEGRRPSTWSATLTFGTEPEPRRRDWTRHPHCGCSWADDLVG